MSSINSGVEIAETGRRLGHDLFLYRRPTPMKVLSPTIREGFEQAAARGLRPEPADRFVRKWLQLRMSAYQRGRAFDEAVTPALIRAIDVAECPVLRLPLTHGEHKESDWSVDRLNNDGAYAANNLAVMSTRANKAKGARSFEEVHARSRRGAPSEGLAPVEWLRLASMMLGPCFAMRPVEIPSIPLAAPIPSHSVRLTMQQIQHVFTRAAGTQAGKNQLIKHFKAASHRECAQTRLRILAEAVHLGLKRVERPNDVWLQDGVMAALQRWRETLDENAWAAAGAISSGLASSRLIAPARLASWHLDSRGYS